MQDDIVDNLLRCGDELPVQGRVMAPNVDDYWRLANQIAARIIVPIGDRYYGLRDFTIADPDGFGIRFATHLPA